MITLLTLIFTGKKIARSLEEFDLPYRLGGSVPR